MLGARWYNF